MLADMARKVGEFQERVEPWGPEKCSGEETSGQRCRMPLRRSKAKTDVFLDLASGRLLLTGAGDLVRDKPGWKGSKREES